MPSPRGYRTRPILSTQIEDTFVRDYAAKAADLFQTLSNAMKALADGETDSYAVRLKELEHALPQTLKDGLAFGLAQVTDTFLVGPVGPERVLATVCQQLATALYSSNPHSK